jgi:pyruvate-formate lyase-activating enzyme
LEEIVDAAVREQTIREIVEGAKGCENLHGYFIEKLSVYLKIRFKEENRVEEESALLKSSLEINTLVIKNCEDDAERFEMLQEAMKQAIEKYDPGHVDSYFEPKVAKEISEISRSTIKEIKRVFKME